MGDSRGAGLQGPPSASSSGGLLPLGAPSGSNVSHRLADIGRSFLARFSSVPQTSQFVDKGTLTPQEFVDAGDLLVFKFPTWQWLVPYFPLRAEAYCYDRIRFLKFAMLG